VGCNDRANAAHSQKTRRPEGFRANSRLASLLLGRRPMKGILPRRASPSSSLHENSTVRNFQTGSKTITKQCHNERRLDTGKVPAFKAILLGERFPGRILTLPQGNGG